ncbi:hypothetical protein NP493_41g04023 [Ridgeia piscesae]|uniref:Uncharacterized protein n=1 Tax=Ridgeia piscesae TaxID=27915 RepID=A0AAD9PC75_RIDPI|nr:hypothetical protein NP493_41g04023 [Ridgeia piscesae]
MLVNYLFTIKGESVVLIMETGEIGDRERRKMLATLPPFGCLN